MEEFKKSIDDNSWVEVRDFYGAFDDDNNLLGVIALKDKTYIALLFVDVDGEQSIKGLRFYPMKMLINK